MTDGVFSDQPNVVGRGLLLMVQRFLVQGCNQITSFKIGMHFEIREKIITAWEDLGNPPFPHILFTSVVISNCDKSVITKSHM